MPGRVVELVDTLGSGSSARMSLGVRVPPRPPPPRLPHTVRTPISRPSTRRSRGRVRRRAPRLRRRLRGRPRTPPSGRRRRRLSRRDREAEDAERHARAPARCRGRACAARPATPPPEDDDFGDLDDDPAAAPRAARARSRGSSRGGGGSEPRPARARPRRARRRLAAAASGGAAVLQGPRGRLILLIAFAVDPRSWSSRPGRQGLPAQPARGLVHLVHQRRGADRDRRRPSRARQLRQVMANPRGDKPPAAAGRRSTPSPRTPRAWWTRPRTSTRRAPSTTPRASLVTALEYRVTGLSDAGREPADPAPAQRPPDQGRRHREADAALPGERRDLRGLVQGPGDPGAGEGRHHRHRGARRCRPSCPTPALASPRAPRPSLPDLSRRTATSGGRRRRSGNLRGTSLESTDRACRRRRASRPARSPRSRRRSDLKWSVTVKNGGDFDERNVRRARRPSPTRPRRTSVDTREVVDPVDRLGRDHHGRDPRARRRTRSCSATRARS